MRNQLQKNSCKLSKQITKRIQEMVRRIAEGYEDKPLDLVCVEHGGREFYNLLMHNLNNLGVTNSILNLL